jgi:hypothetical protein
MEMKKMSKETMKELNGMNIKQLKQLFEITEKQKMSVELAMVRGWLMDAIYAKLGEEEGDLYFGI